MISTISNSEISFISPSNITISFTVPAIIISISEFFISDTVGLITYSPFTLPTLTSDIGPLKGISETAIAAEAAKPHKASGWCSPSYDNNWIIN